MGLQILAQLRGCCRIGGAPDERLAQGILRVGVLRMSFENANALGSGARVVGKHGAQGHGILRIAGIALRHIAHSSYGCFVTGEGCVEGLVIGNADRPVGRMIAIELLVDAHGIVSLA